MSDKTITEYKPVTSSAEILNEIKYILETDKNIDDDSICTPIALNENYISLFDIYTVIVNKNNEFKIKENFFEKIIRDTITEHFSEDSRCVFYGLNFANNEISMGFERYSGDWDYAKIVFAMHNEDLYLKSSESSYGQEIFQILNEVIFNAYNELITYKSFKEESAYNIKTMNSSFFANIYDTGVDLRDNQSLSPNFELTKKSFKDEYTYDCNSRIILNTIKGQEDEIFKCTFVKIEDCPNWMQKLLYEIRKEQIENKKKEKQIEIQRKEDEKRKKQLLEEKMQIKENTKRKILSLFKRTKK